MANISDLFEFLAVIPVSGFVVWRLRCDCASLPKTARAAKGVCTKWAGCAIMGAFEFPNVTREQQVDLCEAA